MRMQGICLALVSSQSLRGLIDRAAEAAFASSSRGGLVPAGDGMFMLAILASKDVLVLPSDDRRTHNYGHY